MIIFRLRRMNTFSLSRGDLRKNNVFLWNVHKMCVLPDCTERKSDVEKARTVHKA